MHMSSKKWWRPDYQYEIFVEPYQTQPSRCQLVTQLSLYPMHWVRYQPACPDILINWSTLCQTGCPLPALTSTIKWREPPVRVWLWWCKLRSRGIVRVPTLVRHRTQLSRQDLLHKGLLHARQLVVLLTSTTQWIEDWRIGPAPHTMSSHSEVGLG